MTDTNGGADADMQVDTDLVRQLAELLNENDLTEIEVEDVPHPLAVAHVHRLVEAVVLPNLLNSVFRQRHVCPRTAGRAAARLAKAGGTQTRDLAFDRPTGDKVRDDEDDERDAEKRRDDE